MHYQSSLIFFSALSLATAASIPVPLSNLVSRQAVGSDRFLIRTDLKQDNDYNRKEGGQPCRGKYVYLKQNGLTSTFVPYTDRASATKAGPLSESWASPRGIPLDTAIQINLKLDSTDEFGAKVHKVALVSGKQSEGTFTTSARANGTEIEIDKSSTTPSWDAWLLCGNGDKASDLSLYWLAVEGNSLTIPPTNKCSAVRLYAEPVDQVFEPEQGFKDACAGKQ